MEFYNSTSERECTALWNAKCDKIGALDLVLSMVYSAVWDCNKNQASALEAIILDGAKKILGCSSI